MAAQHGVLLESSANERAVFTSMRPTAESRLVTTGFQGADCLYRDHLGRRVVGDVEGQGRYRVVGSATVFADESEAGRKGTFSQLLTVVAQDGAEVQVEALRGPLPRLRESETLRKAKGIGWVKSAQGPVFLDGTKEPVVVQSLPLPFFQEAKCSRPMEVCLVDQKSAVLVDAFDIEDAQALKDREWKVQNASDVFELESPFSDGTLLKARHLSHLNAASWTCPVPPGTTGLLVRKLYDRFHGRQRARVKIDGKNVGVWYEPKEDRKARWAWSEFGVPKPFLAGKSTVRIEIDPPAGVPLWSVSRIEVRAINSQ